MNPENQPYIISHAQNREDIILSGFFPGIKDGFYVDVGANDPAADSVTKYFYEQGWSGINIEPINRLYKKLKNSRPRDTNLNIGISNKEGDITFREYNKLHGLSTFANQTKKEVGELTKLSDDYKDYKDYKVEVKTLADVFQENNVKNINFLKVDVEGYEYEVLDGNDWTRYRPQVICIESNHIIKDWRPLLAEKKYEYVFNDGLNGYYVAREAEKVKKAFSYVNTMLPTPIVDYRVVGIIEHYKQARLQADARNVELNNQVHELKHFLYVKQQEMDDLMTLKGLLRATVKKLNSIVENRILPSNLVSERMPQPAQAKEIEIAAHEPKRIFEAIKKYDSLNLTTLNPPEHKIRFAVFKIYRKFTKGLRLSLKVAPRTLRFAKSRVVNR